MRKFGLLGSSALRSVAVIGFTAAMASPSYAQGAPGNVEPAVALQSEQEIESGEDAEGDESIVVTGSRIRRPNLDSSVPVTSIGGEEFFETGQVSIGDVLNELPALKSTFSQANSTRFLGTAGLNLLDLRGLGTVRTLVLVNGRRHVGGDVLNSGVTPDVNTFPTDLIERVDVVTGGNSAIYGSDAIAGVVNFILKRDFEGLQIRGQGGVSKYGDAGSYYTSALAGTNFAEGRGNIAVNLEYAHQEAFYASKRPNLRQNDVLVVVDSDIPCPGAGCDPNVINGSDGIPDAIFLRDVRSATISEEGLIQFPVPAGGTFTNNYVFTADGRLIPQTGGRTGIPTAGVFVGGNGSTRREGFVTVLSPKVDRYSANLIGHFAVSDAFEPFIEAKYVRTNTFGSVSGPAFTTGSTFTDSGPTSTWRERPRIDNPFLSDQARATIRQFLPTATNFVLRKNLIDLGVRNEAAKRETFRIVGGVRGDFNDDWQYEVSANWGRLKEKTKVLGNLDTQRFLLAMDAVRDPATGQIVCRSKIDPVAAARPYPFIDPAFNTAARLAADVAACVPFNPFGKGVNTPEAIAYVTEDTTSTGQITQFVANAFLSGDTSEWFELPGGPVGFALGAEYRTENLFFQADPIVEQGFTFYNAIPTFTAPKLEVKEAFGEIRLPLLSDQPFFHALTVSAAGRVADYGSGAVYAYNGGVEWSPVRDLRLRANYSRAVRAPNQGDLYTPLGQNFAPGFGDPCSLRNIGTGTATRVANCRAAGIPDTYDFQYLQSLEVRSGGNTDLQPEESDSYTIGGVFQPRFIPGFSLSVDYYNITVNDVIAAPTAQQIANACYDAPSLDNQFCSLFERAGPSGGPRGEVQHRILETSLIQSSLNYAALKARGVDVEAAYRHDFEGFARLNTRLTYTHVIQRDNFLNPAAPDQADQILLELGEPQDSFNWDIDLKSGPVAAGYKLRYIGKMVTGLAEDIFSVNERPPQNADSADLRFYPSVIYHDLRLGYEVNPQFNFYMGVDNVMNKLPPFGLTGVGAGSGIYSNRGRFFYAGAVAKF